MLFTVSHMQQPSEELKLALYDALQLLSTTAKHVEKLSADCRSSLYQVQKAIPLLSTSFPQDMLGPSLQTHGEENPQLGVPSLDNSGNFASTPFSKFLSAKGDIDRMEILSLANMLHRIDVGKIKNRRKFLASDSRQNYHTMTSTDNFGYDNSSTSSDREVSPNPIKTSELKSTSTSQPISSAELVPPLASTNPLQCSRWDQIIKHSADLTRDRRTVHKPYIRLSCTICSSKFSRKCALMRHMKSRHP